MMGASDAFRHHMLEMQVKGFDQLKKGDVMSVLKDWHKVLLIIPRRSVNKKWIWGQAYARNVMVYDGYVDRSQTQYGTVFDVLRWS